MRRLVTILLACMVLILSGCVPAEDSSVTVKQLRSEQRVNPIMRIYVVEPAITDHMVLPDGRLPPVCKEAGTIELWACRGEYEPASFVVSTSLPLEAVRIEVGRLTGPGGQWPKDAVDVRVVKDHYRSTLAGGKAAIPTLLVHDESFLSIEPAPTEKDPKAMKNVAKGELRDSAELQPVKIKRHKQFWITVRVPENAKPGTYKTTLRVVPENIEPSELTLQIEVYPFRLQAPMLEYSVYYPTYLVSAGQEPRGFTQVTAEQYRLEVENMLAHGLSNPNIYGAVGVGKDGSLDFSRLEEILKLRESIGMCPKSLYLVGHPVQFCDRPLTAEERQRNGKYIREINAWAKQRGYEDVYFMAPDEWWGARLSRERDSMLAVEEAGGKIFVAVMLTGFFDRVGDVLTRPVLLANVGGHLSIAATKYNPQESLRYMAKIGKAGRFEHMVHNREFRKAIDGVHRLGNKIYTYMNPIGGVPLPDLQRRNKGLGLWRVGFDGSMNWSYIHIAGEKVEQVMQYSEVYRTTNGVVDTLHWEGFREGVDDVRYLTTLLTTLAEASGRFPQEPLIAESYKWIRNIDVSDGDLDIIRRQMAQRIIALLDLGYKELPLEQLLVNVDLNRIQVIALPEPWRFRIDPDDQGVKGRWFEPAIDDSQWATIHTDKEEGGWEKQGFAKETVGFGWYRAVLPLTKQDLKKKFKYLCFGAVDEDAWLYINGKEFFEHTVESTGLLPSELWLKSFSVSLDGVKLRGKDLLAVRVYNRSGMGGIWKPVHVVLSNQELSEQQLDALIKQKKTKD